jgi:hypothetical protein
MGTSAGGRGAADCAAIAETLGEKVLFPATAAAATDAAATEAAEIAGELFAAAGAAGLPEATRRATAADGCGGVENLFSPAAGGPFPLVACLEGIGGDPIEVEGRAGVLEGSTELLWASAEPLEVFSGPSRMAS